MCIRDRVKLLAEPLQSATEAPRKRGMALLGEVMHQCSTLNLQPAHADHLGTFFCNRMHDVPCTDNALYGLAGLLNHNPQLGNTAEIASLIFKDLSTQTLPQKARGHVFQILGSLLHTQRNEAFVLGFVEAVSGERDPRNLLRVFELFAKVARAIPEHAPHAEAMFEVVSCYFPITFQPPPNDKHAITNQALRDALHACFCSSPAMAEHAVPYLLEQAESLTFTPQKVHPFEALQCCFKRWHPEILAKHAPELWTALSTPILSYGDPAVVEAATETVGGLATALGSGDELQSLLGPVLTRCTLELRAPSSRVAECCANVAAAIAGASVVCCAQVSTEVLPAVLSQLQDPSCSDPVVLLTLLHKVVDAARKLTSESPVLSAIKPQLVLVATAAASVDEPIARGDAGCAILSALLATPALLGSEESAELFEALCSSVRRQPAERSTALVLAAEHNQDALLRSPVLSKLLGEGGELMLAASLCQQQQIWERCFTGLVAMFTGDQASEAAQAAALCCETFIATTGNSAIPAVMAALGEDAVLVAAASLVEVGALLRKVSKAASQHHPEAAEALWGAVSKLVQGSGDGVERPEMVPAFAALLPHHSVEPPFLAALAELAVDESLPALVYQSACDALALLVNRRPGIVDELRACEGAPLSVLKMHASLLRGLVLKGHNSAVPLAQKIIMAAQQLGDTPWASVLFGGAMEVRPGDGLATGFLWQQRFFCSLLPQLAGLVGDSQGHALAGYLGVIGVCASSVPEQVLLNESGRLMPLVRAAMADEAPQVRAAGGLLLHAILSCSPTAIQSELPSVLPKMLALCVHSEGAVDATGRVSALEAIEALLQLPYAVIFPYKVQVLAATQQALDDPKYVVRKAAVRCRNKWTFSRVS
eukprot:TRINITY_DN5766_c0_g1_i1.p1 TRINITY_DN5766_c0_g1~~TRINITY_DN5766_c0_g1_i1.p1  ORF type:complete len:884 (-),score=271.96 TRINITY_DN5766_c0_g1_i1:248-2899(-)